jgi:dynein heavy chain
VEAEGEAGAEGEAAAAPEEEVVVKAPDMVYTLDIKSGVWKAELLEGEAGPIVEVPDFLAKRDALLVTLEEMGVPGVLARAMCRPKTEFDNWSADGAIANAADGTCPQPRKRFTIDIKEGIIYVYGGCDEKGTIFYDDVWSLDVKAMAWTRVYACEIEKNLGNGRNNVWCGMKVIGLSKGQVGEALEVASVIDIGPMLAKREDKDSFQKAMTASVAKQIADITAAVTKVNTQLDKEVAEGDDAELHNMMNALMYMRQNQLKVEYDLDQLTDTLTYMRANNMGKIDPVQKKLDEALDKYSYAKKTTPTVKKNLKPLQDAATLSVFDKLVVWEAELEEYRAKFTKKPVFKAEAGYAEGYVLCGGVHTEMLEQEKKMADIAQLADLFEANDKAAASKEIVEGLRADLVRVKNLWDLSCIVESQVDDWKVILWPDIQPARMEEEAKAFQKAVKACDKAVRGWDVYRAIDASVKNFLVAMPCVSDLKSPSMRDRHWQKLMDVTKVTIDVKDPAFSLADLIALNLQDYVDDVGEVVDCANKEDKMEQTLVKLAETWKVVEFNFDQHADSDVYLIGLGEENFEMLEENQLVVQGMMASKYLATFEEEVTGWQKNLSSVSDVLGQMSETQRKWAYLETLFIGSDEVKKELPEDAARFAKIDVDFKAMLKHFKATPNCVESCSKDGLIPELETIAGDLELCEKALADFLEAKRIIFPRFYFVSQVMLLDILSNGNRPWTVLKNVNAMFQGVKEVKLSGDPAITVEAFESNEGEKVEMATVMPKLKLDGKVENYLNLLIAKMRNEFRAKLEWVLKDYDITGKAGKDRPAWLANAPCAQLSLVTTQYRWTMECEIALNKMEKGTDMKALEEYYAFQIEMLSGMIKMVQGDLPKLLRRSAMNVITLEAHSRDISYKLVNEGVQSVDHFLWLGQLKTRWEKLKGHGGQTPALDGAEEHDCVLYICDALFRYSFEYLGCAGRLVITPLTDRIYITATQSAHLVLGCAPQGPAGTGKTESTKDLSAQLGKAVYVFNCGPEMDYRTMGDIFKGLASSGSWGCFDEFNRLMAEVLSVCTIQYKSVLEGIRAGGDNFRFNGKDVFLHPDGCMAFITMNPGYLGRQELPESLKVLFRPVTVMVPDFQLIMENMMMAEGYTEAAELAKKFFTLYNLAGDLLGGNPKPTGKQLHYDWGLRAINSVLKVAGEFLRNEKAELLAKGLSIETLEEGLLMRALRDFNLPKIGGDDNIVFMGLIRDLFAKVFELMPQMRDPPFEDLCRQMAVEEDKLRFPPQLTASTYFIANVVDLQALLALRHCVFVIGLSGNNKSETWKTLSKAWTKGGVMGKTVYKDINPKSITPNELYGFINMATREWKDGLLSSTMRDMANAPDANPKWIILDGDLDANWIENMNSVMDDNRLLTLASNERIRLLGNMKLLFEIRDLLYASPATVTRAGVLFISDEQQWKNYAQSWVDWWAADLPFQVKAEARKEMKAKAEELIEKYCGLVLLEIAMYYTHIVPLLEFGMIQALLNFLQGLWVIDNIGVKDASALEIYFVFACVWAFGGAMSITSGTDFRKKFSGYWKDTWKTIKFPHRGEIYDVFVDKAKKDFVPWSDVVPELNFDSATQQMSLVTVPTMETVATAFWLDNLLPHKHGAMLIGSAGCGKTALINGKLRSLPEEYSSLCVNINYYTNSFMYQKVIEAPLEKKARKHLQPLATALAPAPAPALILTLSNPNPLTLTL